VSGNVAYIADGVAGLAVIDVTDPTRPLLQAMLKTTEAKAVFVVEGSSRVFVTDRDWGLLAVDRFVSAMARQE
jgi:hypothetical protein